jgi:hypothetical protein
MKKVVFFILNVMLVTFSVSQERFNDITILEASSNFLVLEFSPIYDSIITKTIDNVDYQTYQFANNVFSEKEQGSPAIASRYFTIGLPSELDNSIEIVSISFESIRTINYLPTPYFSNEEDSIGYTTIYRKDDKYYQTNNFYPENMVELLNIGVARDRILGTVRISPLQYNPVTGELKKYNRIKVKITFNGNVNNNTINTSIKKDDILKDIILNYNQSLLWVIPLSLNKRVSVTNSVLSSGNWYKIEVKETGIYKLDATFFRNANIDMSNVDPRTIRIYGNGGAELDENPENTRFTDPEECAIYAFGEDDGTFNSNDYFLFYGESPNTWVYDGRGKKYRHFMNHYSTSNYYFLTFGGNGRGKRVERFESDKEGNPTRAINLSSKYFIEPEQTNINTSGRQWYSRPIMSNNPSANFQSGTLDGILYSEPILYRAVVAGNSTSKLYFVLYQSDILLDTITMYGTSGGYQTCTVSDTVEFLRISPITDNKLNFKLEFRPNSIADVAYLDWIEVFYKRGLSTSSDEFQFYTPDDDNSYEYNLSGFSNSNIYVFDVTEHNNLKLLSNGSISAGNISFQKKSTASRVSEIIAVGEKGYKSVVAVSRVVNSNLHGITDGADYIVVSPNDTSFLSLLESYKMFRENSKKNPLKTIVVNLDQIYNEFSSGKIDPTAIRNFLRYALDNWSIKPSYVMLFGDGSYDYKNITNSSNHSRSNRVPVWQTKESNHAVDSYTSDDFFVRLIGNNNRIDMNIGRLPVQTASDARNAIDKIIAYENSIPDPWRNKITFVADDGIGSGDEGSQFTDDSERLVVNYIPKQFNLNKIYIVKYKTVVGVSGRTKPDAVVDIIKAFNDGTLLVNYVGHGNSGVWTHEGVFRNEITLPQLTNNGKYPLVVAATCGFGKYDDLDVQSGTELLVLQRNSGAIAVFAASRAVYINSTSVLNSDILGSLFLPKLDGSPFSLGEVMFRAKQQGSTYADNDKKFHLIGDPAVILNIPYNLSEIDTINGEVPSVTNVVDLKALNKVKLTGFIKHRNNILRPDYNGKINVTVYDAPKQERILEGIGIFNFETEGGIIYSGTCSIVNGRFETEFYVPKDISYEDRTGKMSMYFDDGYIDGFGYNSYFKIVGSQTSLNEDINGPVVNLYLNDRNFRNGDLVSESPLLIVDLFDESGINTTELGVGHRFEAFLDNSNNGISLSSYYKGQIDSYKEGTAEYKFSNLPNGNHTIKVKVFDVFNNPSSKDIGFKVENKQALSLQEVMNYPNPFSKSTKFTFHQNQDDPVDVSIRIYTVAGRLIKILNEYNLSSNFVQISWDGRDEDGDELANGVYLYKVILKTFDGKTTKESFGKLSILK